MPVGVTSPPFQTTVIMLEPAKPFPDKVVVSPACPEVELIEMVGVIVKTTLAAVCPALSWALILCAPPIVVGIVYLDDEKLPEASLVFVIKVSAPSQVRVMVELASKPAPETVIFVPTGPEDEEMVIFGVTLKFLVGAELLSAS